MSLKGRAFGEREAWRRKFADELKRKRHAAWRERELRRLAMQGTGLGSRKYT